MRATSPTLAAYAVHVAFGLALWAAISAPFLVIWS